MMLQKLQTHTHQTLALNVEGMKCGRCVSWVHDLLKRLPGVEVKHVEVGAARIVHDPSLTSEDTILGALWEAGYRARKEIPNDTR